MVAKIQKYTLFALISVIILNILCIYATCSKKHIYNILLWTSRHTKPFNLFRKGRKSFTSRNCEFDNCNVTFGKSFVGNPHKYDAILFNAMNLARRKKTTIQILPRKRSQTQKYVLVSTESAADHKIHPDFNEIFNWTWTYKLNSDIVWPKFVIRRKSPQSEVVGPRKVMDWVPQNDTLTDKVYNMLNSANKNQIVASFLTNCNELKKFDDYMDEINEAFNKQNKSALIIEYAKQQLGKFQNCYVKYDLPPEGMKTEEEGVLDCYNVGYNQVNLGLCERLNKANYFFHLVFENSVSEDYVSDKLLTALSNFAVPVVLGGADYSRFLPDGSYINAEGLKPEHLVEAMIDILKDFKKYEKMHRWRSYYTYHAPDESPETDPICQFCAQLNNETKMKKRKSYSNISSWFNFNDNLALKRFDATNASFRLIDLYNFTFKINSDICNKEPPLTIVSVIPSKVTHFDKRRTIRETWGQPTDDLKVVFILGESQNETIENQIIEEHNQYGDIVQGNLVDSFKNLSYKHIMALKWVTQHCQVAKYILKADDDVFVHLDVLEKLINDHLRETDEIICHVFFGKKPLRQPSHSKYIVSKSEYPFPIFLPYCSGPFVLYNPKVAPLIVAAAETEPYFFLEDVFVGMLRRKLNLSLTDISQIAGRNFQILSNPSLFANQPVLYVFDLKEKYIRGLWKLTENLRQEKRKAKYEDDTREIGGIIVRYNASTIIERHQQALAVVGNQSSFPK